MLIHITFGFLQMFFIAGVGFKDLFPESLEIFSVLVRHVTPPNLAMDYNAEKYIQRAYYLHGSDIKADQQMKINFLVILDRMLAAGSSVAYLIKEAMISMSQTIPEILTII